MPLILPGTQFEKRVSRLDLRLTKQLRLSPRVQLQLNADAYNVANASSILAINTSYGSRWLRPIQILEGRIFQFSSQLSF